MHGKRIHPALLPGCILLFLSSALAVLFALGKVRTLSSDSLLIRSLFDASGILPLPDRTAVFFENTQEQKLCRAIEAYDVEEVKRLLKPTVDVNQPGKHGVTPLLWALLHRYDRLYEPLLAHGADPNTRVSKDVRLYSVMLQAGDSFLLGCSKNLQLTGLELAVKYTDDIDQRDAYGNGVLPHFIANTYTEFERPAPEHFVNFLHSFLRAGLDVNTQYAQGNTALHFAIEYHLGSAIPLLECGANPLVANRNNETAIDLFLSLARHNPDSATRNSFFEQLRTQGFLDDQICLTGMIQDRFPDWTPPRQKKKARD